MRVVAVVQARLGSTRLPRKILAQIGGLPMLAHVLRRVRMSEELNRIPVVLTTPPGDIGEILDVLGTASQWATGFVWLPHEPPELLQAFYWAALATNADAIVRITADCPFIAPEVIDETVRWFRYRMVDYRGTTRPDLVRPDGMDVEVVSVQALHRAVREAPRGSWHREHVTSWIWSQPEVFRLGSLEPLPDAWALNLKLSVDSDQDLEAMRALATRLPTEDYSLRAVLAAAKEVGL